jgi:hypothetical protein
MTNQIFASKKINYAAKTAVIRYSNFMIDKLAPFSQFFMLVNFFYVLHHPQNYAKHFSFEQRQKSASDWAVFFSESEKLVKEM